VPLYRAVETTRTLLHVAAERGVTHARLNLKPAELGGIEVRLQSTPQGVAAQLVADSPEAARMLSQAGDDLRRQLAERDVTLLSLDVSTSSEQRHDNTAGGFSGFGDDSYRPDRSAQGHGTPTDAAPASPAETTLVLPDGVLVDVLA
jgi:flagellar hook-length control protein FliK